MSRLRTKHVRLIRDSFSDWLSVVSPYFVLHNNHAEGYALLRFHLLVNASAQHLVSICCTCSLVRNVHSVNTVTTNSSYASYGLPGEIRASMKNACSLIFTYLNTIPHEAEELHPLNPTREGLQCYQETSKQLCIKKQARDFTGTT